MLPLVVWPEFSHEILPSSPTQFIESAEFPANFADLLRAPTLIGQVEIESPKGELLPENGNALPPIDIAIHSSPLPPFDIAIHSSPLPPSLPSTLPVPTIEPAQRVVPQGPAPVSEAMLEERTPQRPDSLRIYPEIPHAAQFNAHRRDGPVRRPDAAIRPDEGLRGWQALPQADSRRFLAPASPDNSLRRVAPEIIESPIRSTIRSPAEPLQNVELPEIVVPRRAAEPRPVSQGAHHPAAIPEIAMPPKNKQDTRPTALPRLEPAERKVPTDGFKTTLQASSPLATVSASIAAATASGNTAAATVSALPMPSTAPTTAATPTPSQVITEVKIPVLDSQWGMALNERVTWMAGNKIQNAEIRMNPAELGPVRVQVSIDDGSARVFFDAQHALTREAIELALPRLRDMLSEHGLQLTDVGVSGEEAHHGRAGAEREPIPEMPADAEPAESEDQSAHLEADARTKSGLVDTFV